MKGDFKKAGQLFLQILTVIVVFSVIAYGLWRINLIRLPMFIENLISADKEIENEYVNDGYEIFKYITEKESNTDISFHYPEITPDNLSSLLNNIKPYDNFYWESTAEIISSTGSTINKCRSRISGDKYNIEIVDTNGSTVRKCISDGERTVISSTRFGEINNRIYEKGLTDFYSDASIISIDHFKDFDFPLANTEILYVKKDEYNLVSVSYSYLRGEIIAENNYLISLDYGVVLFAECFEDDVPTYRLFTDSIYPLTSLDDELFRIGE